MTAFAPLLLAALVLAGCPDETTTTDTGDGAIDSTTDVPVTGDTVTGDADATGDAVSDTGSSYRCTFGDIDGDNDLDLFVTNHSGVVGEEGALNWLYENNGRGEYTRLSVGLQYPRRTVANYEGGSWYLRTSYNF